MLDCNSRPTFGSCYYCLKTKHNLMPISSLLLLIKLGATMLLVGVMSDALSKKTAKPLSGSPIR